VKSPNGARFRTVLQREALRVFEVSSLVRRILTTPPCLQLEGRTGPIHRAPAFLLEFATGVAIVEIKRDRSPKFSRSSWRTLETRRRLHAMGVGHFIVCRHDVHERSLQEELARLIAARPVSGRHLDGGDVSAWDPFFRSETDIGSEMRWLAAQRECDALLARVMRRHDPGELALAPR
jgi:hypothetical protein